MVRTSFSMSASSLDHHTEAGARVRPRRIRLQAREIPGKVGISRTQRDHDDESEKIGGIHTCEAKQRARARGMIPPSLGRRQNENLCPNRRPEVVVVPPDVRRLSRRSPDVVPMIVPTFVRSSGTWRTRRGALTKASRATSRRTWKSAVRWAFVSLRTRARVSSSLSLTPAREFWGSWINGAHAGLDGTDCARDRVR